MFIRNYTALLIQWMIWSGFSLVEWLSKRDQLFSKVILFGVFLYLAFILARMVLKSNRKTMIITVVSLSTYITIHLFLRIILQLINRFYV